MKYGLEPCPLCEGLEGDSEYGTCGKEESLVTGTVYNPGAWWDSAMRGEEYAYIKCEDCGLILKAETIKDAIKIWNNRKK